MDIRENDPRFVKDEMGDFTAKLPLKIVKLMDF